ncbi:MAG: tRNA (guanosine(46)-N7)-methyltransferase TrmB [Alphaproteobacteria bacterium]|nr:tRNA (guanosine(46)-N7)-methyltransferase TrmB [Alphaproteobacteria bacterium]
MEKQEIRTFGRRHGKKLSIRQQTLIDELLPTLAPETGDILEIGFGAGEHVRDLARNNPGKIIIGAEPFMNGVASLLSAITDEKTNRVLDEYAGIRIWADDVRDYLRGTDSKFEQIWILHPDPWPKARHEKRRLLSAEFLNMLSTYLSENGEIIIGTDHWEYFDWILEQIKSTNLTATIPNMDIIQTRYQHKNKAGTVAPKYLILTNH